MTATVSPRTTASAESTHPPAGVGFLPGFGALAAERSSPSGAARAARGPSSWPAASFLALGASNAWLISNLPADVTEGGAAAELDPLGNLIGPVSTHVFVIVAIFAVIALITAERESGTLAWTASKPVSRSAIWLAKFASATGIMWIAAGILPLVATVAIVVVLYGAVPATPVAAIAIGMGMVIALYVAVALFASTFVTSQAAVAGITLAVLSLALDGGGVSFRTRCSCRRRSSTGR